MLNNYIVTCCSTADMSKDFFESNNIPYVCFHFSIDEKEYIDDLGQSIPFNDFYQKMADGALTSTSQVNVAEYEAFFEPYLKEGLDIIHITLSSGISGAYNSALVASLHLKERYPDRKISIVDSLGASSGYGLLVTYAHNNLESGMSFENNVSWLVDNRLNIHHWFYSTDLTWYYRGGRISKTSALFGSALHICPVLDMNCEGKLIPRSKCRGKKRAIEALLKIMDEHVKDGSDYSGKCYISHSVCDDDVNILTAAIKEKFPKLDGDVVVNSIGTVIGSHTGPGTVALFFVGDKRVL